MTDVQFRFRKGAGSNLDVLFGTVTLKPTLAHSRGTSMVLPAPSTWDIINGEVLATNVQPTPEPVGGQIEWGYEVTVKDRHGKSYSFLVGVPDSTTAVEFVSLPRYFETKPPLFGQGPKGDAGEAATISVGTVTSGAEASVTNSGTSSDAKLDFVLPKGDKGDRGDGVPAGGTALQYLRKDSTGATTEWVSPSEAVSTKQSAGFLSAGDKTLLDGATSENIPGRFVRRSASGQIQVSDPTVPASAATKGYTDSVVSNALETVADSYQPRFSHIINIMEFGAVGDGVTDDTPALQAALEQVMSAFYSGGSTLFIPPGVYNIDGYGELVDNLHVYAYGAIFTKSAKASRQASFVSKSNGTPGYGSGCKNVFIEGLTLEGNFSGNKGNGFALHHADNLTLHKVTFRQCVITGHAMDLGGCSNILVDECVFEGWKLTSGREFTEAIQLDYSTAATLGVDTIPESFDGLPTINVEVKNSRFIPLTLGATVYPAPNPIGTHTRVEGFLVENINFHHNFVLGGSATVGFSSATARFHKGWISIGYAKSVSVTDNLFWSTLGEPTRVININAPETGYTIDSVSNSGATMVSIAPVPVSDFSLSRNTFKGFSSGSTTARDEPIVYLRGYSEFNKATDFLLEDLRFEDSSPASEGAYSYEGQIGIDAAYIKDLKIIKPVAAGISQLMRTVRCEALTLSQPSGYFTSIFLQDESSEDFTISGGNVRYPGGAELKRTGGVLISGIRLKTIATGTGGALAGALITLSGCTNIQGRDLTVDNRAESLATTRGLWIKDSSQAGRVDQTLIKGTFGTAGVRIEANSDTVTNSNPIVGV